jgi:tetratricopeptide (TPR) repeat protein
VASDHPSRDLLGKLMRGRLPAAETRSVLQHLVAGCTVCRDATAALWELPAAAGAPPDAPPDAPIDAAAAASGSAPAADDAGDAYDRVIDRVFRRIRRQDAALQREAAKARELSAELGEHPFPHQLLLVGNSPRFRSRSLCELLLERCHEAGFQDPQRAVDLAHLAVAVAHRLAAEDAPVEIVRGVQARAWAQLGNALRVSGDHAAAEQAFASAEELLAAEPRIVPLDRARVLDQLASLRRDQGRYGEAFHLLDRVVAIFRKLGQWHLLGRALAQKSMVSDEVGDVETEMALLRQALDLLDPQADPRMFLAARHNLILALNQCGRHREAFALLYHTRPLYLEAGDRINLVRLRWLEGAVAAGLGRIDRAEAAFREVRDAWAGLGLGLDAALAALDLAGIYARQGRAADMRRLAEEMLVIFQSQSIQREALAAILLFHQAALLDEVGTQLVQDLAQFLKRSRNNPALQFARMS